MIFITVGTQFPFDRLVSAIDEYVISKDLDVEVRFDIIAIVNENNNFTIEHLEDAFFHF